MSKYKAIRTECDGIMFASKREAAAYQNFRALERSGAIRSLELQVPYPIHAATPENATAGNVAKLKPICKYVADFVVTELDGTVRIYDAKGFSTPVFKLKKKFVEAEHNVRIVEI